MTTSNVVDLAERRKARAADARLQAAAGLTGGLAAAKAADTEPVIGAAVSSAFDGCWTRGEDGSWRLVLTAISNDGDIVFEHPTNTDLLLAPIPLWALKLMVDNAVRDQDFRSQFGMVEDMLEDAADNDEETP